MNTKRLIFLILLIIGTLFISACSGNGGRNAVTNWSGLTADSERAYISTGSFIYAVNVTTGKEIWKYPSEASRELLFYATPVLTEDGQLLVGSEGTNHAFISLDTATGNEKWSEPFSGAKSAWVAPPLVFNNTIYAPNTDGSVYVLDMTGKEIADPIQLDGALWSAPVTDGAFIYVASLNHKLYIIDPATNEINYSVDVGGAAPASPVVSENGIYLSSFSSDLQFIDSNGKSQTFASPSDWVWGTPALDSATLFYADLSGNIYSSDIASGNQNWNELKVDGAVVASLLVVQDQIYVVTEAGSIISLDRDGKTIWQEKIGEKVKIYTTPVFSNDLILVAPYQSEFALAAYDATGEQVWTFTPQK